MMSAAPRLPDHLRARNILREFIGPALLEYGMRGGERDWFRRKEGALHYTTRPGAFIERQPDEVRALLRHLRSDDQAREWAPSCGVAPKRRWRSSACRMPGTCPDRQG